METTDRPAGRQTDRQAGMQAGWLADYIAPLVHRTILGGENNN